jgi:hypothetical protein
MSNFYSIPATAVHVEIQRLSKPENLPDVYSLVNTTFQEKNCVIEWVSTPSGCSSQLRSIYCTSAQERQQLQARMKRLEEVLWSVPPIRETKKADPVNE